MEVNEVDISESWKKILNFMEPKLHKGVFNSGSTSFPHPKRLQQFCLFNKLQAALHTTFHLIPLDPKPLKESKASTDISTFGWGWKEVGFSPKETGWWTQHLQHEIQYRVG